MTKEQILDKQYKGKLYSPVKEKEVLAAMDEYSKQQAIAWGKFLDNGHWRINRKSNLYFNNEFTFLEEDQLYNLFIESQK